MHSSTKFMAGHSDSQGGVLIAKDEMTGMRLRSQRTNLGNTMGTLVCLFGVYLCLCLFYVCVCCFFFKGNLVIIEKFKNDSFKSQKTIRNNSNFG